MLYSKYNFKTEKYKNQWNDILKNADEDIKYIYKDRTSLQPILSQYRKVFRVTPSAVKQNSKNRYKNDQILIALICIRFTNISIKDLLNEFKIDPIVVESITNDNLLDEKYKSEINKFFKPLKEGFLLNKYQQLAFQEEIVDNFISQCKFQK